MNLYLSHNYRTNRSAGSKAKSDVEAIMSAEGFRNIGLPRSEHSSAPVHFLLNLAGVVKGACSIRRGDVLFLQYPLKKYFTFMARMARMRGAQTVALVHDLGCCRRKALTPDQEVSRLSNADYVIATNDAMRRRLVEMGLDKPMGSLRVWDYLTASEPIPTAVRDDDDSPLRIAYAGALSRRKNSFLYDWGNYIRNFTVDVYGSGFRVSEAARSEKFAVHGFVEPENLISGMTADFGLVWDGDSIDSCTGDLGEYLALNTPHKVSLYIRAHLPIIIWSKAAMAPFVTENNIGFTVDSLAQLPSRLKALSPGQINQMRENVEAMSSKIAAGTFFREAAAQALKALGK